MGFILLLNFMYYSFCLDIGMVKMNKVNLFFCFFQGSNNEILKGKNGYYNCYAPIEVRLIIKRAFMCIIRISHIKIAIQDYLSNITNDSIVFFIH